MAKLPRESPSRKGTYYVLEQTDTFFPNHPNRRRILAQLLNVPAALLALVELEPASSADPPKKSPLVPTPSKHIDLEEYQNTLRLYWFHRHAGTTIEKVIRDIRLRIDKLHGHVLYVSTPQKRHMIRLLCGYQILLGDIAQEQQCWTAAQRYFANAIILAHEKDLPNLHVIALFRRMAFFDDLENGEAALDNFAPARKLLEHVPSQLQGKILASAATAQARIARDDKTLTRALNQCDEASKLIGQSTDDDFMFSMAFDQERYLLDRAATFMAPTSKKLRAPQKAQDLLDKAAKEHFINIQRSSAYRQAYSDLIQAKIYFDQGYDPVTITSAESVLTTLKELGSGIHLNSVESLVKGLKERDPHNMELANLELALMKLKQPYLFH